MFYVQFIVAVCILCFFFMVPWLGLQSVIFSSLEPKAQGELIVWDLSRRPSVCVCPSMHPCVHTFKHEYL